MRQVHAIRGTCWRLLCLRARTILLIGTHVLGLAVQELLSDIDRVLSSLYVEGDRILIKIQLWYVHTDDAVNYELILLDEVWVHFLDFLSISNFG